MIRFAELISKCNGEINLIINAHKGCDISVQSYFTSNILMESELKSIDKGVYEKMVHLDSIVELNYRNGGYIQTEYHFDVECAIDSVLEKINKTDIKYNRTLEDRIPSDITELGVGFFIQESDGDRPYEKIKIEDISYEDSCNMNDKYISFKWETTKFFKEFMEKIDELNNGIVYIEKFIDYGSDLFNNIKDNTIWDERMKARKTASFGVPYNYSGITYPKQDFTPELSKVLTTLKEFNLESNNCLINYYLDGKSKMGFHSDQTDILEKGTGIGILSVGETRVIRFKNIHNEDITKNFILPNGSFIHMTSELQKNWKHSIPKSDTDKGRMSLTFRNIKNNLD
jgi:hypothetical protein